MKNDAETTGFQVNSLIYLIKVCLTELPEEKFTVAKEES